MKEKSTRVTQVLALLCFGVFALCVTLVLLSGASRYRDLVTRGETSYDRRTALQYLTTRVNQAQRVGMGDLDGCRALILEETVEGECYTTWVYQRDGWLWELYAVAGAAVSASGGEPILEAGSFDIRLEADLLELTLGEDTLLLYLLPGGEVRP